MQPNDLKRLTPQLLGGQRQILNLTHTKDLAGLAAVVGQSLVDTATLAVKTPARLRFWWSLGIITLNRTVFVKTTLKLNILAKRNFLGSP